jgi:peptide deformylase
MKSAHREKPEEAADSRLSAKMASIGVVQAGHPVLRRMATSFDLPAEAHEARRVAGELKAAIDRAATIHCFAKGMAVAAPQLGISRAAAVVQSADGDVVELFNPRIVDASAETDEQYEGCWSFFDVRGRVRRPLHVEVEHQTPYGAAVVSRFDHGLARLVAHEIDHLRGLLYTDRMDEPTRLLPIAEYRELGRAWQYPS